MVSRYDGQVRGGIVDEGEMPQCPEYEVTDPKKIPWYRVTALEDDNGKESRSTPIRKGSNDSVGTWKSLVRRATSWRTVSNDGTKTSNEFHGNADNSKFERGKGIGNLLLYEPRYS